MGKNEPLDFDTGTEWKLLTKNMTVGLSPRLQNTHHATKHTLPRPERRESFSRENEPRER